MIDQENVMHYFERIYDHTDESYIEDDAAYVFCQLVCDEDLEFATCAKTETYLKLKSADTFKL